MFWLDDEAGVRIVCPIPPGSTEEEASAIIYVCIRDYMKTISNQNFPDQLTLDLIECNCEVDEEDGF